MFDKHDINYEENRVVVKIGIYCFLAGVLGGLVGTAGGIILGLLFLQMNMSPLVVASTNQYLALISTISVTVQFLYMDVFNYPFALYLGFFVLTGSVLGITQVNRLIKITGR